MGNAKITVSIETPLLERAEALARQIGISRSRLFGRALWEFLLRHQRYDEADLRRRINEAYADHPAPSERAQLDGMRRHHWRLMKGQW